MPSVFSKQAIRLTGLITPCSGIMFPRMMNQYFPELHPFHNSEGFTIWCKNKHAVNLGFEAADPIHFVEETGPKPHLA